jgi:hypothetical protein
VDSHSESLTQPPDNSMGGDKVGGSSTFPRAQHHPSGRVNTVLKPMSCRRDRIRRMYLRWTSYDCPSCGLHLESRIVSSPRVGPEQRICRHCGVMIRTPDKEWQNMTRGQRLGYFLSEWSVAWLGIFILGGAILEENHWLGVVYGIAAGLVWLAPSYIWKLWRVKHSLNRYSSPLT